MDTITLALMGAKYIAKLISGSKTFEGVKEATLQNSLKWVKTKIFGLRPQLEQTLEQTNDGEEKETILNSNLMELLKDQSFKEDFQRWINKEQEEPIIKNYIDLTIKKFKGNINAGDHHNNESVQQTQRPGENVIKGEIDEMEGNINAGDVFGPKPQK